MLIRVGIMLGVDGISFVGVTGAGESVALTEDAPCVASGLSEVGKVCVLAQPVK
jgi:hypothetical protein